MTGIELKIWVYVFALFVVAPAWFIAFIRRWISCDGNEVKSVGRSVFLFILCSSVVYGVFVFAFWDDDSIVEEIFAFPIAIALAVLLHSMLIISAIKLFQIKMPTKISNLCEDVYYVVFLGTGWIWLDMNHPKLGNMVNWLKDFT